MLVHTLPLCIKTDDGEDVSSYLSRVQDTLFESMDHDLVSIVGLAGEYNVNADILFVYQGEMFAGVDFGTKTITRRMHKTGDAMAKLSLDVFKQGGSYTLSFEYRKDLYLEQTIDNFAHMYINIVKGLTECDKLCEIALCGEREREFYRRVNDNEVVFDRELTVVDLFRRQVSAHPDNIAVCFKDKKLTYAQLDRYSENLARLLAKNGVRKEQPVGIMVKRCELFPICTLAVLKAGGACQPLDSNYPQDRLEFMLEDSKAKVVIADDELAGLIRGFKGTVISAGSIYTLPQDNDTALDEPDAHTLFALIYTSGSTGKPKGCMLEHANLVNFCISFCERFGVSDKDRFAAYGAFGFDASMQDMYPALTSGASVYIVPEETRLDLAALNEFVIGNRITMMDCTTQLGRQYITAYPQSPYMRVFTVGGEKLVPCEPPQFDLVNTYGPTECTIYVSDCKVDRRYESVPIGKSFGNCDIYILDKSGRLLPPGAVGELAVSGLPVCRGYLGRDELTKEKFIPNNIFTIDGYERMYLTGDVCRYLSDGNIQFVGRRDEQVKIRGFRIELTEIERRIREYDGITDASVIAAELASGGKAVVAYVVSQSRVDVHALSQFIREELPGYMVPSVTMQIERIPITPNGKVDKKRLPKPAVQSGENAAARQLNSLEKALCAMVGEITGFEWEQSITVEEFQRVRESDWNVPSGGTLVSSNREIRSYRQVLDHYEYKTKRVAKRVQDGYDVKYKDMGNGQFKEIKTPRYKTVYENQRVKEPVYRQEPIYDTKYYYDIDKWKAVDPLKTSGSDHEPIWAETDLPQNVQSPKYGDRRQGARIGTYWAVVKDDKGSEQKVEYSLEEWEKLKVGDKIQYKTRRFSDEPL